MFDWQPLWFSLRVALMASLLAGIAGIGLAQRLRRYGRRRWLLDTLLMLPLVLPPVVTGFALLLLIGRRGPIGRVLWHFAHTTLIFSPAAAVIAAAIVAFPLVYQSARSALESVDGHLEDAARSLGAAPFRVFWTVTAPIAAPGLAGGMLLAFARALGEFGATVMVAGNIPGRTLTAPVALYFAAEDGDWKRAATYALALALLNAVFVALATRSLRPVAR